MAIAIPMINTNEELLRAANEGDMPRTPNNWTEKDLPAYLYIENGQRNRVISHPTLMMIKRSKSVRTTTRKVYMVG
jgi:hypothetical protein